MKGGSMHETTTFPLPEPERRVLVVTKLFVCLGYHSPERGWLFDNGDGKIYDVVGWRELSSG